MKAKNSSEQLIDPRSWDLLKLRHFLAQASKHRVMVVGDVGVDRYTVGTVERISPEAPVPIVLVQEEQLKLGLAANVADNLHALGGRALLIGVVGQDGHAATLRNLLRGNRIGVNGLVVDRARRTVLKERVVSERQQLLRIDYESIHPVSSVKKKEILERVKKSISQVDAVIIQDYSKGLLDLELTQKVIAEAKKQGVLVAIDPNLRAPIEYYRGADILTPNTREAAAISKVRIVDSASLMEAGERILKATQARYVVITRGKDGMAIFTRGKKKVSLIPTYAKEVYDVSGAGDTVISMVTLALVAGASVEEAATLGNLAAGVEVGKRGTATVSPEEIIEAMRGIQNEIPMPSERDGSPSGS